jgi:hypothetical protein
MAKPNNPYSGVVAVQKPRKQSSRRKGRWYACNGCEWLLAVGMAVMVRSEARALKGRKGYGRSMSSWKRLGQGQPKNERMAEWETRQGHTSWPIRSLHHQWLTGFVIRVCFRSTKYPLRKFLPCLRQVFKYSRLSLATRFAPVLT